MANMRPHLAHSTTQRRDTCQQVLATPRRLAPFVLSLLREAQLEGRRCTLDELGERLRVRRSDLRRCLSALHEHDLYDVLHQRLTLAGFAAATALETPRAETVREVLTTEVNPRPAPPVSLPRRAPPLPQRSRWRRSG